MPWKTREDAKEALEYYEDYVAELVKHCVPLNEPFFCTKMMDLLLDKSVYFKLPGSAVSNYHDTDTPTVYKLGTKVQNLPTALNRLIHKFIIFSSFGELTGYNDPTIVDKLQRESIAKGGSTLTKTAVAAQFKALQLQSVSAWIKKNNSAIDEKTLVSISVMRYVTCHEMS